VKNVRRSPANEPCTPEQIAKLNLALAELARQHSMDQEVESHSGESLAEKKNRAKRELIAWATARQLTLHMPSSVKKAVESASEATELTVTKGMAIG
jgi:hypothetical protein